ncbi:hypothetical protein D3C76_1389770 [compost metagenome]
MLSEAVRSFRVNVEKEGRLVLTVIREAVAPTLIKRTEPDMNFPIGLMNEARSSTSPAAPMSILSIFPDEMSSILPQKGTNPLAMSAAILIRCSLLALMVSNAVIPRAWVCNCCSSTYRKLVAM